MECGCGVFRRARTSMHKLAVEKKQTKKTHVFLGICRLRTLNSIFCEYEGRGTLISKTCIRFGVFTREKRAFFKYPFSKYSLKSPDSKVSVLPVHFQRLRVNAPLKRILFYPF